MDLVIFENGDGGDLVLDGSDLKTTEGLFNQVYLGLFGGNVEQTTLEANNELQNQGTQRFDWWANSTIFQDVVSEQMNSLLERRLENTAVTSSGRAMLEATIKSDLSFLKQLSDGIDVSVTLVSNDKVKIVVTLKEPGGLQDNRFVFLWNGTKVEEIGETQGSSVINPSVVVNPVSTIVVSNQVQKKETGSIDTIMITTDEPSTIQVNSELPGGLTLTKTSDRAAEITGTISDLSAGDDIKFCFPVFAVGIAGGLVVSHVLIQYNKCGVFQNTIKTQTEYDNIAAPNPGTAYFIEENP